MDRRYETACPAQGEFALTLPSYQAGLHRRYQS